LCERDFYTISRDVFRAQLELLGRARLFPVDAALIRNSVPPDTKRCFLCFDDGTVDHYEIAFPVLQQLGMRATFFVPTIKLDRPGYLTRGQIREMTLAGHTIGCHSHQHERMDSLSEEEAAGQIQLSVQHLRKATGVAPWIFAPPGGFASEAVVRAAVAAKLGVIRTMRWGFNRKPDLLALETIPLTRHTTARQFSKILQGKFSPLQYTGKEAIKALLPSRAYEIFRGALFKLSGKS